METWRLDWILDQKRNTRGGAGQVRVKSVIQLIVFTNVSFDNCTAINITGNLTLCSYSKLDPGPGHTETLYQLRNCFLSLKLCQNSITGNIAGGFWKETEATWLGLQLLYQAGFPCAWKLLLRAQPSNFLPTTLQLLNTL